MDTSQNFWTFLSNHLSSFLGETAFMNFTMGHVAMILIGLVLNFLAIA